MKNQNIKVSPDLETTVAIVGGGVSGIWTAYKLAKAGIPTTVLTYTDKDRGGLQGSSSRSVGAVNTSPFEHPDFTSYLDQLGQGLTHPSVADALKTHLTEEIDELSSLFEVKKIKMGITLSSGSGKAFLQDMYRLFKSMGGQILEAWVTRLVVNENECRGLQYEKNGVIGKLRCRAIVLAAGGYASLFYNSLKTGTFGTILGRSLECGSLATNLEFLFKHGYGNIDADDVTPTERIAGAEIYDENRQRITWLEKLLFSGKATTTHLQAVQYWNHNSHIDLSYQPLYLKVQAFNSVCQKRDPSNEDANFKQAVCDLTNCFYKKKSIS